MSTIYFDVDGVYHQIFDKYMCRGCGEKQEDCTCPKYGDEWKAELEDSPERQR